MSSVSPSMSASNIEMDYMTLLIAQLQNQNPLEPLDNNEMATQLAQFSQLSQLETMNENFEQTLLTVQFDYASSLIGKEVRFFYEDPATGLYEELTDIVREVSKNLETNEPLLGVWVGDDEYWLNLDAVMRITEPGQTNQAEGS